MDRPYDVFISGGADVWIGATETLPEAIQLIGKQSGEDGSTYMIYHQESHRQSYFRRENNRVVRTSAQEVAAHH